MLGTTGGGAASLARYWRSNYAALGKDAKRRFDCPGSHYPGLWVTTAHGSRGMVSAPLAPTTAPERPRRVTAA